MVAITITLDIYSHPFSIRLSIRRKFVNGKEAK